MGSWVCLCGSPRFWTISYSGGISLLAGEKGAYLMTMNRRKLWHHQDADPDFGSCQAKELLDHLETLLVNKPVVVNRGHQIFDVKPQGVSKGLVTGKVVSRMVEEGKALDFVVCIGEDISDEDMFECITTLSAQSSSMFTQMFACQVLPG